MCRSHSRTRAKEGAGPLPAQAKLANSAAKASLPSQGRPERQSQARPPPISLRLGGIPEDLRQAALAIQKKRQEAEAAAEEARKEAEALEQKLKETVAEPPVKPSPSKWNGKGNPGAEPSPAKRARLPSSSERAREELTLQETLHRAEGDLGTQAAVKASPSFSGSEIGGDLFQNLVPCSHMCCVVEYAQRDNGGLSAPKISFALQTSAQTNPACTPENGCRHLSME